MKVIVTVERRFDRTPDGRVWTPGEFSYLFWKRYLRVFSSVEVVARVRTVQAPDAHWIHADGPSVHFVEVPYYVGPLQFALKFGAIRHAVSTAVEPGDAVILRVPSTIATTMVSSVRKKGFPYGLEVVGDPNDVFAPGSMSHPLRSFFRWWYARNLEQQCLGAVAVSYVTEKALQQRYPASSMAFTTHYSSVELPPEAFVAEPRNYQQLSQPLTIVSVGSLQTLYKSPDVVIDALAILSDKGIHVSLLWVGDGQYRPVMEQRAKEAGVSGCVHFLGQLPSGDAVREQLDLADLFLLPSRAEGLPRAMIEAMARALPCVGANVGGIGELLAPEDMVESCEPGSVAGKLEEVLSNPRRLNGMSRRNLIRAQDYRNDVLDKRRMQFYEFVSRQTIGRCT